MPRCHVTDLVRHAAWPAEGRKEPDAAARAYLIVIGREPEAVGRALGAT